MKVQGYWWTWGAKDARKRALYGRTIKKHDHDERLWLIYFDNGDDNALIQYNLLLKYVNKGTLNFASFNLPANSSIAPPEQERTHHNERFVIDTLNWTEIFEDTNYPEIPDITPIE